MTFLAAYAVGWRELLVVAVFAFGVLAVSLATVLVTRATVTAERRVEPVVVSPGETAVVALMLEGPGTVRWRDPLPPGLVSDTGSGTVDLDGRRVPVDYRLTARSRGLHEIGPLRIDLVDALGLISLRRPATGTTPLTVLPRVHQLSDLGDGSFGSGMLDHPAAGIGADQRDLIPRDYRDGDSLRTIDWRATAHRGGLMVRSESRAESASTVLVLDQRITTWVGEHDFEVGIEYVASLAAASGPSARLVVGDGMVEAAPAVLRTLAGVERSVNAARLPAMVDAASGPIGAVFIVTGAGAAGHLAGLPEPPSGATGTIVFVGGGARVSAPLGWRVQIVDPDRAGRG